ncbi:putative AAA domain-containing protein Rv2559c/MT2636 [Propionispora sp. 2/2-37]|uniref:replication-associated recombination protein A n=1 Tax=Propionispora sp. 2/2-37 TaxID=1677858 RepID=UPI0006BB7596|nr:replication-associated recombination protein A [Propionispora sp. 2/2-37]CUH94127.1 putative AAA domain-containing protein Rv2559c/MT2636 [Propionispora sp. 2/2-37]
MDLFSYELEQDRKASQPLAARMRPESLEEFIGQETILGKGTFLRRMIEADHIPSIILFGPPGTGKTTLATVISNTTGCHYEQLNAVAAGVADIRRVTEDAKERLLMQRQRTLLFIDEIHRFHKGQQDALLPYVEDGTIILIGATTENPYFEVNSPLLSRMRVIRLQPLDKQDMIRILKQALQNNNRGLGQKGIKGDDMALEMIAILANGDARTALNILEQSVDMLEAEEGKKLTVDFVRSVSDEITPLYDKSGDQHYDVISAFIKSMRGSDPDAALHYLARLLAAGEDVKFIARRLVICAAEDVGNADPQALNLAMSAAQSVQFVGMPEARIPLAQAVIYIACAPKSNAAYVAIDRALRDVKTKDCGQVPFHLRDAHYKGARQFGHGEGYQYPHDYEDSFVRQQYLPDNIFDAVYYEPTDNGQEALLGKRLQAIRQKMNKAKKKGNPQ